MFPIGTKELETERIRLRKFRHDDVRSMYHNWASDENVTKFLSWNIYSDLNDVERYINQLMNHYNNQSFYYWAIELKDLSQVIGSISATIDDRLASARISFCIGQKWWNQRIMQETVKALVPFFMEDVQACRLEACCESGNNTAGKVLIRSGFQAEGILRKAYYGANGSTNLNWFAIMRDDYLSKKSMQNITLDDLYITNYRENGGEHFKSITRLTKEEAFLFAEKLSGKTKSRNNRYGDYFERYYEKRIKTEELLFQQFMKRGGKPKTQHPIYFVLCDNKGIENFYGNADAIKIPLKDIPSDYISFTPRDSMHLKDMGILPGNVWNKATLFEMLQATGRKIGNMILDIPGMYGNQGGYMEVQVWNDDYLKNHEY